MTDEHVPPNFLQPEAIVEFLATNARVLAERSRQPVTDEKLPDFEAEMRKEGEARGYPISAERVGDVLRRCGRGEELDRHIAEREARDAAYLLIALNVVNEHNALVIQATGLRRRILELHGPDVAFGEAWCRGCDSGEDDYNSPHFPCTTYTLARDWMDS
jgi:hypothetical protein